MKTLPQLLSRALQCIAIILVATSLTNVGDAQEEPLRTELRLSDDDILVGDWIGYRLTVVNKLMSSIQLRNVKASPNKRLVRFLECRVHGGTWGVVREESAGKKGRREGNLEVAGHATFAFPGQFFLTEKREFVFGKPGKYEIRVRFSCLLGDFTSESHEVTVRDRPADEFANLWNSRSLAEVVLSPMDRLPWSEKHDQLHAALSGGSVKRSLGLLAAAEHYKKTGKVKDEECGLWDAFKRLEKGLDTIRHDMVTAEFVKLSHERKEWAELERLLEHLKEESHFRGSYAYELANARKRTDK